MKGVELSAFESTPARANFRLLYSLRSRGMSKGIRGTSEKYVVDASGVEVSSGLDEGTDARLTFPALVSDGERDLPVRVDGSRLTVGRGGHATVWEVVEPAGVKIDLTGPRVAVHTGWMRAAVAELPRGAKKVKWRIRFEKAS